MSGPFPMLPKTFVSYYSPQTCGCLITKTVLKIGVYMWEVIIKTLDSVHNDLFSSFKFQIWATSDRNDWEFASSWQSCCCCWSLLYSVILRFWTDSLRSHVIIHVWIAFYSAFLNIHQSVVLSAAMFTPMPCISCLLTWRQQGEVSKCFS